MLLDEPTVGLDPIATREFYQSIDQLKQQGCSIVLCSHVLPGVEKYIDHALILGQGQQLAAGSIKALREQADLPATFQLHGLSADCLNAQLAQSTADGEQLTKLTNSVAQHSDGSLSLQVAMADRMQYIRQFSQLEALQNLDIHLPSLEDLYGALYRHSSFQHW